MTTRDKTTHKRAVSKKATAGSKTAKGAGAVPAAAQDEEWYVATLSHDGTDLIVSGDGKSGTVQAALDAGHTLRLTLQRGSASPGLTWNQLADFLKGVGNVSFGTEITCVG